MGRLRSLAGARRALRQLHDAVDAGDWESALAVGMPLLDEPDLPTDAVALSALALGQAAFMVGDHVVALELLERGLGNVGAPTAGSQDLRRYRYWAGMSAMILGDLEAARTHFLVAADAPARDAHLFGVSAARRGLAQVEMELGNLDAAMAILDPMVEDEQPYHMAWALRAAVEQRAGLDDAARVTLSIVREDADIDGGLDRGQDSTMATIMVLAAEVYVELGHADEVDAVLDDAHERFARTGLGQSQAAHLVPVLRAEAVRMRGDFGAADRFLAAADAIADPSPEVRAARARAKARLAHAQGDTQAAAIHFASAAETYDAMGYRYQADATRREAETGPVEAIPHPPLAEVMRRLVDVPMRDGVLVTLTLSDDEFGAEGEVRGLQQAAETWTPAVEAAGGEFDGWETGDGEFTVYLYGDPDAIWAAIEPDVRRVAAAGRGGYVVVQQDETTTRLDLEVHDA